VARSRRLAALNAFKSPVDVNWSRLMGSPWPRRSPNQTRWAFYQDPHWRRREAFDLGARAGHWTSRNIRQTPPRLAIDFLDLSPEVVLLPIGELIPRLSRAFPSTSRTP
jgi:hypothetical protein